MVPTIRALGPGSVSSFLKVILDVLYVVLWCLGGFFALIIFGLLLVSFDPAVLPAAVIAQTRIMGQPPSLAAALLLFGGELYLVCVLVIVQRLRRVFGAMTAGDPFHPDNVRRLRVIGLFLALIEIDNYVFGALSHFVLHLPQASGRISLNLTGWFAVLVVFVLAEVFREGARLRRDAELTI
jgi:hypothetical protein